MSKKNDYLKSPDLLPIKQDGKKIGTAGFSLMWVGMAVVLAAFAIGGAGIQNMSLGWVLVAGLIGCVLVGAFITLIGDIGIEHGVSFPVYMRAPFGTVGTHVPSVIRGLAASFWFGINTFFGATAINGILMVLFSFDNWFVCYVIFALVQLTNTAFGIKAVERFADLAAPIIIFISIWIYFTLTERAAEAGRSVWTWVEEPVTGPAFFTAFMIVLTGIMGFWATLACDMPSISRFIKAPKYERNWFKRNKSSIAGSLIAMPLVQTFIIGIGAVSYAAVSNYDPVVALQESASGIILVILLVMIVLAQWSTNIAANVVPAATIFSNVGGPKVPFWVGVFIAGIVGSIVQPWNLFGMLISVLGIVGGILSAIVGILFTDYYILRKRRVNVHALYEETGQYRYLNGVNVAGFIAFIIGGIASYFFVVYSFFVGFLVGGACYYVLAKYWWFKRYKQAEIEDPSDEKYLGITVGRDWEIEGAVQDEKTIKPVSAPSKSV